jgi:hypothetical protein
VAFPNLSEIVTTTLRNRTGELADNMSRNNAALLRLSRRGNVKTFSGGRTIVQELNYADNQTFEYLGRLKIFSDGLGRPAAGYKAEGTHRCHRERLSEKNASGVCDSLTPGYNKMKPGRCYRSMAPASSELH